MPILCAVLMLGTSVPVAAQRASPPSSSGPSQARAAFERGNRAFVARDYLVALSAYQEALAGWDHPVIRFNLAVCLIELDRSLEALEHLERALAEDGALGERTDEARNYLRLLRARVGSLRIDGLGAATVMLDGSPVPTGQPQRLEPGRHVVVVRAPGFATWTRDVVVGAGEDAQVTFALQRPTRRYQQRWSTSTPWLVLGGAAALGGAGGLVVALGNARVAAADAALREECPGIGTTCELSPARAAQFERARRLQGLGGVLIGTGSAGVLAGLVMLYLNRPREVAGATARLDLGPDAAVVSWAGRW